MPSTFSSLLAWAAIASASGLSPRVVDSLNEAATEEAHPRDNGATRAFSDVQIKTSDGRCLFIDELSGDFRANLTPIQVAACGSTDGQGWDVITAGTHVSGNGVAIFVSTLTQACFNVDTRRAAGNQVLLFSCGGRADGGGAVTESQVFAFDRSAGPISLTPRSEAGSCLTVRGNALDIANCNAGDPNQSFTLGGTPPASGNGNGNGNAPPTIVTSTTRAAVSTSAAASNSVVAPTSAAAEAGTSLSTSCGGRTRTVKARASSPPAIPDVNLGAALPDTEIEEATVVGAKTRRRFGAKTKGAKGAAKTTAAAAAASTTAAATTAVATTAVDEVVEEEEVASSAAAATSTAAAATSTAAAAATTTSAPAAVTTNTAAATAGNGGAAATTRGRNKGGRTRKRLRTRTRKAPGTATGTAAASITEVVEEEVIETDSATEASTSSAAAAAETSASAAVTTSASEPATTSAAAGTGGGAGAGGFLSANPTTPVPVSRAGGTLNPTAAAEAHQRDAGATRAFSGVEIRAPNGQCISVDPTAGDFRQNLIPVALVDCTGAPNEKWDIITAGKHNNAGANNPATLVVSALTQGCISLDGRRPAGDTVTLFSCGGRADGEGETNAGQLFPYLGQLSFAFAPVNERGGSCILPGNGRLESGACPTDGAQLFSIFP